MANIEDCPGFETFGADVKAARNAKHLSRRALIIQLIKVCGLPVERYFNPEVMREESAQRQRVSHKLKLCPEHYLPVIEGAIDGALKIKQSTKETPFLFEKSGILRADKGVSGIVFTGEGA